MKNPRGFWPQIGNKTNPERETVMVLAPTLGYKPASSKMYNLFLLDYSLLFKKNLYFFTASKYQIFFSFFLFLILFIIFFFSFCGTSAFMTFYSYC